MYERADLKRLAPVLAACIALGVAAPADAWTATAHTYVKLDSIERDKTDTDMGQFDVSASALDQLPDQPAPDLVSAGALAYTIGAAPGAAPLIITQGYSVIKSPAQRVGDAEWDASVVSGPARPVPFRIEGPDNIFVEVDLKFAVLGPGPFPGPIAPPDGFTPPRGGMFADGAGQVSISVGSEVMFNPMPEPPMGTPDPISLFEGAATLVGPDNTMMNSAFTGDFAGMFTLTDGAVRYVAQLVPEDGEVDVFSESVRLPTNTLLYWNLDMKVMSLYPPDPIMDNPVGAGAAFGAALHLTNDPSDYQLVFVPEPATLALLGLGGVMLPWWLRRGSRT